MIHRTDPPITVVPPFVLPDRDGKPFNTARLRGRRHGILLFLSAEDPDAAAYLRAFAARQAELAWMHTAVVVVVPAADAADSLPALPFPILRDTGQVRARVLPDVAPEAMALIATDLSGQVMTWRTARRVASLPDVETALGWAWEVAQPKGSCGGVTWSATAQSEAASPPAPVGRFTVGVCPRRGYRRKDRTADKVQALD